ncbi:hypothetical protein GCM10020254_62800 [Streptomyces goshikiensis]
MASTPSRKSASRWGVPVEPAEVDLPAGVEGVDELVQIRNRGVRKYGLQRRQPQVEHLAGRAAGHQGEVLAGRGGAVGRTLRARLRRPPAAPRGVLCVLVGFRDVDQPGVHGDPPGLARVHHGALVSGFEPERRRGLGQLGGVEFATDPDAGAGAGPAG